VTISPCVRVGALLLACALAAAAQTAAPDGGQAPAIRGVVVNSVTREPISRALVYSPDNRFGTLTDSQGRFEFSPLQAGSGANANSRFLFTARKPGFLEDFGAQVNVAANPAGDSVIELVPEALIVGRVTLVSGEAPDKINVSLYRRQVQEGRAHWVPAGGVQTRSTGEFRFSNLVAGTYKVFTNELSEQDPVVARPGGQQYGYPPVYYPGVSDFASAGTIALEAGRTAHVSITIARQPYYTVKIPVAIADQNNGVQVSVSLHGRRGPGYSLGYNNSNHTIEGSLPNGVYNVEGLSLGQKFTSGVVTVAVKGASAEGPVMALLPSSSIAVSVTAISNASTDAPPQYNLGNQLRGVRNKFNLDLGLEPAEDFVPQQGGQYHQATDGLSGTLQHVAPGHYWLRIFPSSGYVASVTSGGVDLLHNPLVVGPDGPGSPIEINLRDDFAQIEGKVDVPGTHSASGSSGISAGVAPYTPPAFLYCVPLPDSSGLFIEVGVQSNGSFSSPMAPGSYRLLGFRKRQLDLEYENNEAMRNYDDKGVVMHLVAGQTEHVRVPLVSSNE
jgi:hypothetical protein